MSVTNHRPAQQAKRNVQSQNFRSAPHGNPAKGAKVRHQTAASAGTTCEPHITLVQLMHDKSMISDISETLLAYTQRNVSFEIQKAIAITIMTTAIAKWGCSIVEAASRAADCCRFNTERVRQWAFVFINDAPSVRLRISQMSVSQTSSHLIVDTTTTTH